MRYTLHRNFFCFFLLTSCLPSGNVTEKNVEKTFLSDVEFLKRYVDIVVLKSEDSKMQIAISASLQGRVMTSTANGDEGFSFGWINKEAFASGDTSNHMNAFGGEDRLWLGPEGGQFSIYFEQGKEFTFENWHVPRVIDLDPFDVIEKNDSSVSFVKKSSLTNYIGTTFDFSIKRKIALLSRSDIGNMVGEFLSDSIDMVGYESVNTLQNTGAEQWTKDHGMLSIWILGMFNPSPSVTVFLPVNENISSDSINVNDRYFGDVPKDRLVTRGNIVYFKADGKLRSKIGLAPQVATEWLGSYDDANHILTIVHYNKPNSVSDYVNSFWEIQQEPFGGDAINAYNDGPPSPGAKPMGPFYELETSSPAAALQPGDSIMHKHSTMHFHGDDRALNGIIKKVFGVTLSDVRSAFSTQESQ